MGPKPVGSFDLLCVRLSCSSFEPHKISSRNQSHHLQESIVGQPQLESCLEPSFTRLGLHEVAPCCHCAKRSARAKLLTDGTMNKLKSSCGPVYVYVCIPCLTCYEHKLTANSVTVNMVV